MSKKKKSDSTPPKSKSTSSTKPASTDKPASTGMSTSTGRKKKRSIAPKKPISRDALDRFYQNTELLMQNYRTIAWVLENFPTTVSEELNRPFQNLDALLASIDIQLSLENRMLESRLRSVEKSRYLMERINEAVSLIRKKPEDGERLYNVLYTTYIAPEKLTHQEILFRLDISSRQYYRFRRQALKILAIRLWSTPNAEISSWLELIYMLEPTN